ncbi:MAG: DUF2589 domain-containing protein [Opitutales bacterium]|nr:DUF2589 domain-containing protein [Opitutales bacterium]
MPVSGRELATLDFGNLIGGPLNAVVEAQAKSAITTANFIKEVAFDKDGKVVNVDFKYNRKNDDGKDQEFTLTVPFLTMIPVPYISVKSATVEFNAKITSTIESRSESNFNTENTLSVKSGWFVSAKLQSKVSYQKSSSATDKEERTYDMRVKVEAENADMPSGTERILTILEQSITERKGKTFKGSIVIATGKGKTLTLSANPDNLDITAIKGASFTLSGTHYKISDCTKDATTGVISITVDNDLALTSDTSVMLDEAA